MVKMLAVQPFQETLGAGMCGPASLKMVLGYYGVEHSESVLAALCGTDREMGTSDLDLKRVAEQFSFTVEIHNESSLADIEAWLGRGVPVIVDWFTRGRSDAPDSTVADGHYSVVVGLDDTSISLQDPEVGGVMRLDQEDFLTVWFDFTGKYIRPDELIIRQLIAVYR